MTKAAESNECLKARACMLIAKEPKHNKANEHSQKLKLSENNITGNENPSIKNTADNIRSRYKKNGKIDPVHRGASNDFLDKLGLNDTRGCCPGQTGHHLIYDAWLRDPGERGGKYYCSHYNEKTAPTVCLVGHDKSIGQHGKLHKQTDDILEKKLDKKMKPCDKGFSMECAIEVAAKAHRKMFKQCNKKCIIAQLKKYYDQAGCTKLRPVNKDGQLVGQPYEKKSEGTSTDDKF